MSGDSNRRDVSEQSTTPNPFPGPRPFKSDESKYFFGREREKLELTARILANRVVFLYAKSGAGKTSLLNASLLPSLGTEEDFDVLPVVRLNKPLPTEIDPAEVENVFIFNTLRALTREADAKSLLSQTLTGFLFDDFIRKSRRLSEHENRPAPRILVFDQFEEIFTSYPERWKDRNGFFVELAAALEPDPREWERRLEAAGLQKDSIAPDRSLRVLFALREDHLANLHSYADLLPVKPTVRVRIEQLRSPAACEAVERPAELAGRPFEKAVAWELVKKLLETRVKVAGKVVDGVEGEFVEPVQLQIICNKLFQNPSSNKDKIDSDDLSKLGDVNEPLAEYYNAAIAQAVEDTKEKERVLRDWFEHSLITPAGTRGTAFMNPDSSNGTGIGLSAVGLFENLYLIRGEHRPGGVWYELTHDRFIEPVLQSNKRWREQYADHDRQKLEDMAEKWSKHNDALLNEAELTDAENWLTTREAAELGYSQTLLLYIKTSRTEVDRMRLAAKTRAAARLRQLVAALAVLSVFAFVAAGFARFQSKQLEATNLELAKQREAADIRRGEAVIAQRKAENAESEAKARTVQAERAREEVVEVNERLQAANKRANENANRARESAVVAQQATALLKVRNGELTVALKDAEASRTAAEQKTNELNILTAQLKKEGEELDKQKRLADQASRISQAREKAANSRSKNDDQFNSVELAVEAINKTKQDNIAVNEALESLNAVFPGVLLEMPPLTDLKRVVSASFTAKDTALVTVTADGIVTRANFSSGEWEKHGSDLGVHIGTSALTPDGRVLAVSTSAEPKDASDNSANPNKQDGLLRNVKLINLENEQDSTTIFGHRRGVLRLGLDSRGEYLATSNTFGNYAIVKIDIAGKSKSLWDKPSSLEKLKVRIFHKPFRLPNTFAFSHPSDGDKNDPMLLAIGFQNGEVLVRQVRTGELHATIPASGANGHTDTILAMAFHPRLNSLVTSSRDDTVKLWSLSPEALKADKKIATFERNLSTVNEWGADSKEKHHANPVTSIAFDKEGRRMATGSEDGTVLIWEVDPVSGSYKPAVRLPDHTAQVTSVTFSVDGKRLASIAGDNTARVWDLSFFDEYLKLKEDVDRIAKDSNLSTDADALGIPALLERVEVFLNRYRQNHKY